MEEQHLSDRLALEQQHALQLRTIEDEHRTVKDSMEQQHQTQLESKVSELSALVRMLSFRGNPALFKVCK